MIHKRQTKHLMLEKKTMPKVIQRFTSYLQVGSQKKGVATLRTSSNVCLFSLMRFLNSSLLQFWQPFFHHLDSRKRFDSRFVLSFATVAIHLAERTSRRIYNVSPSSSSLTDYHFLNNDRQFHHKYLETFAFQFVNLLKINV